MTDNLAAALAQLQADLPEVRKGETAEVLTKKGGKYSYSYADLADCSRAILPVLGKHGLSFSALPTMMDGRFVLNYVLRHVSGESDGGLYPLPDPTAEDVTPQEIGSAITYARRYTLCAVTGLAPAGDDDDGRAAARTRVRKPSGRDWKAEIDALDNVDKLHALWFEAKELGELNGDLETRMMARAAAIQAEMSNEEDAESPEVESW